MDLINIFAIVWTVIVTAVLVWWIGFRDSHTKRAREDIFSYVKSYKNRCNGMNRYVVTVETLQDAFREYETVLINQIWLELIDQHIIEQDPQDGVWCVR